MPGFQHTIKLLLSLNDDVNSYYLDPAAAQILVTHC